MSRICCTRALTKARDAPWEQHSRWWAESPRPSAESTVTRSACRRGTWTACHSGTGCGRSMAGTLWQSGCSLPRAPIQRQTLSMEQRHWTWMTASSPPSSQVPVQAWLHQDIHEHWSAYTLVYIWGTGSPQVHHNCHRMPHTTLQV